MFDFLFRSFIFLSLFVSVSWRLVIVVSCVRCADWWGDAAPVLFLLENRSSDRSRRCGVSKGRTRKGNEGKGYESSENNLETKGPVHCSLPFHSRSFPFLYFSFLPVLMSHHSERSEDRFSNRNRTGAGSGHQSAQRTHAHTRKQYTKN